MTVSLSKKTLVPLSLVIGTIVPSVRYVVGLEKDLRAAELRLGEMASFNASASAETIAQLRSLSLAVQEIDIRGQRSEEKLSFLIKLLDRQHRFNENP